VLTCLQGSSQAGPAGDDVVHEESLMVASLGFSEFWQTLIKLRFCPPRWSAEIHGNRKDGCQTQILLVSAWIECSLRSSIRSTGLLDPSRRGGTCPIKNCWIYLGGPFDDESGRSWQVDGFGKFAESLISEIFCDFTFRPRLMVIGCSLF
jgi:hypothetical protein